MSITVFIRTPSEVHDVEISGNETLRSLHDKAAEAAGFHGTATRYTLRYEGTRLKRDGERVQSTDLVDGCELLLELGGNEFHVCENDIPREEKTIKMRVEEDPDLLLVVNASWSASVVGLLRLQHLDRIGHVRHIRICDPMRTITGILPNFLSQCRYGRLATVSFELPCVTIVHDRFIADMWSVSHVDLTGLPSLKEIGAEFISCTPVASVDVSPLHGVQSIGSSFLSGTKITSIDLTPLSTVKRIGDEFCAYTPLAHIDLRPLEGVGGIGRHFLTGCQSLTEVDLSPLKRVPEVGKDVLSDSGVPEADRVIPRDPPSYCCVM
eukprot:TRINITY_DN7285_c0_g4_i1.p1 TRINITY_DN7285_c0_g4~~TRINITY_DN7285_c0_g4_i1.p1  ORF type:complete len:341 (+),score=37.71 TRINITY_DN7285_c0_g4_i1:55-1023(+)